MRVSFRTAQQRPRMPDRHDRCALSGGWRSARHRGGGTPGQVLEDTQPAVLTMKTLLDQVGLVEQDAALRPRGGGSCARPPSLETRTGSRAAREEPRRLGFAERLPFGDTSW